MSKPVPVIYKLRKEAVYADEHSPPLITNHYQVVLPTVRT